MAGNKIENKNTMNYLTDTKKIAIKSWIAKQLMV